MKLHRITILSLYFIFLLYPICLSSHTVNIEEAQQIANSILGNTQIAHLPSKAKLRAIEQSSQPFYIFNSSNGSGYVIVSGDNRTQPILGYSQTTSFDADNIPPGLNWLLEHYRTYIETLEGDSSQYIQSNSRSIDKPTISPLLTTKWDQGYPYNNLCPNGSPTGCVPTAIAQIVNYHQWPDSGEGEFSYTNFDGNIYDYNYKDATFNYDLMLDEYDLQTSTESINEVAKLMYACGVGMEASYDHEIGTGSSITMAKRFLIENFKYSSDAKIVWRHSYYANEWNNLIYNELQSSRPVYMQGGNHAFVCDGYGGDNYFHINWGWAGEMDGYFLFSSLKPYEDDYRENLYAMINIHKREGAAEPFTFDIINTGEVTLESGSNFYTLNLGMWYNYSRYDVQGTLWLECQNVETSESVYKQGGEVYIQGALPAGAGVWHFGSGESSILSKNYNDFDVKPGKYKIYPAYSLPNTEIRRINCIAGGRDHIELIVTEDYQYIYSYPTDTITQKVEIIVNEVIANPSETTITYYYTVKNHSDLPVHGISVGVYNQDNIELCKVQDGLVFEPNSESSWNTSFSTYLRSGTHHLIFYDHNGQILNTEPYYFQIEGEGPEIKTTHVDYSQTSYNNYKDLYYFTLGLEVLGYSCRPDLNVVISKNNNDIQKYRIDLQNTIKYGENEYSFYLEIDKDKPLYGEWQMDVYDLYGKKLNDTPLTFNVTLPEYRFELSDSILILNEGDSTKLDLTIHSNEYLQVKHLWASSNESIVTVSQEGVVKAVSQGKAFITVTSSDGSNIADTCEVTVIKLVSDIVLEDSVVTLSEGDSIRLQAKVSPESADNRQLIWSSSDETIVTVSQDGVVNAISQGKAFITVTSLDGSNISDTCEVTVEGRSYLYSHKTNPISIMVKNSIIYISGGNVDSDIYIYNFNGVLIYKGLKRTIKILNQGIYIIHCDNRTFKVVI